jgi:hypothetical protein
MDVDVLIDDELDLPEKIPSLNMSFFSVRLQGVGR